ncbi:CoA transferase subunit A [Actinoallomurus rhizosphaericola]|uniref:CoA transferase subunit A n=1 Tax=Actinoallomurus rhizosphaericola TaxID=2952536 RepID=UPI002092AAA4|nr:CoA-transferase [Actinoallomurus rhizosphaericola]MCO5998973.1 CoA transferase subunit A [Actinoallomurus rhizosphaericola]
MATPHVLPLAEAVATLIHDGDTVALEGFTHLIPYAAGHEIIRQRRTGLTLVRMTPDVLYDQMIGMGVASRLIFSWGGNPGVGSLHRFRDAVEHAWPNRLSIEEHTHAGMAARYVAAASGLPFGVLRGYLGTDLPTHTDTVTPITCPFTGQRLTAVRALALDIAVVHAQQVDRHGNVGIRGIPGVQKEAVLAARRALVTVEERVETLDPRCTLVLPSFAVTAVSVEPRGAHPSYAMGYYDRDNDFYTAWDPISRDRTRFLDWMRAHVLETRTFAEHLALLDADHAVRTAQR